jgi:adenylate cyclase
MGKRKIFFNSLMIGILISIVVILFSILGRFETLELMSLDWRFYIRGKKIPPDEIVIVSWDDASMDEMKTRYQDWQRSYHAKVIENLKKMGAKVIGFDVSLRDPNRNPADPEGDKNLAKAFYEAKNVILDANIEIVKTDKYEYSSFKGPLDLFVKNNADYGIVNVLPDSDNFLRTALIVKEHQGTYYLSFPLKVVCKYLDLDGKDVKIEKEKIILGDKIEIPYYSQNGNKFIFVNFRGGTRTFKTIPYYQVYEGIVPPSIFKDKIVLIGIFSETVSLDLWPTPFGRIDRVRMPGVEFIANTIYTILYRDFLKKTDKIIDFLLIIFLGIITSIFSYKFGFLKGFFLSVLEAILIFGMIIYLFESKNLILPMVSPVFVIFLSYGGVMLYRGLTEEREKRKIRDTFARYVTQQVVEEILGNPEAMELGGKRKECTILFSDIRGFTTMSEKMPPEEVVSILNEYFNVMVKTIFEYGGTLDKFIGDAIMAVWGAPVSHPDDPKRAVLCALQMRDELKKLQRKWKEEGKPVFDTGIGINTGEVVVGNIGSVERMDYTVIGDNVNLASRLESLNKEYKSNILISEMTYQKVKDIVEVRRIEEVQVKGKTEKVMIYEVIGKK